MIFQETEWNVGSPQPYVPPTWGGGTDEEIVTALQKHYSGEIDLTETWDVGDERTVSLSAMSATGVGESHVAQTVTLVLVNQGGKTLTTAVGEITSCLFVWQVKNCLSNGTTLEGGYMNSSRTNSGGWNSASRRTWCNEVFYNALPSYMKTITRQVQNVTTIGDKSTTTATSNDYCALPAAIEIGYPSGTYVPSSEGSAWSYYSSNTTRLKYAGDSGSTAQTWWMRTPNVYGATSFCPVKTDGSRGSNNNGYAEVSKGIAPFGCI